MNITNKNMDAKKPKINMIIKRLSRKQVIILMTDSNAEIIINSANQQIANINRCLKEIKLDITADFIYKINDGIAIITNKATAASDLRKLLRNILKTIMKSIQTPSRVLIY